MAHAGMTDPLIHRSALVRWSGERGTYHVVLVDGDVGADITMHERMHRLELGQRRGFGSVKVFVQIGVTRWKSSVFPSSEGGWFLLVSKKVMRAEDLAEGDPVSVELELL